ncbi:hypothetical protein M430DRAFT_274929 [Amorphotheca resinae ATCC 22711]|uniref:Uncharacterized protein n=1 Tax=Amorphotheca resinae ATCC 22711 TaxID=857342 RepID=A0A2T3B777_AMORE|nr:hypothetical protein M430DRAFT_274929 [Amorphotheca resinae ATCC 22711]PSS22588.1 hypothetical protein M430DRAFT_274929 [Amorphotheca resinae ATCC 22711]
MADAGGNEDDADIDERDWGLRDMRPFSQPSRVVSDATKGESECTTRPRGTAGRGERASRLWTGVLPASVRRRRREELRSVLRSVLTTEMIRILILSLIMDRQQDRQRHPTVESCIHEELAGRSRGISTQYNPSVKYRGHLLPRPLAGGEIVIIESQSNKAGEGEKGRREKGERAIMVIYFE